MNSLCVIVPFFNEEKFLKESLERINNLKIFDQIILVDDCSTDNSSNIGKKFVSEITYASYIKTEKNSGKGAALALAANFINTSHVVIHDADLEYYPIDIVEMYSKTVNNKDSLILGSRFIGNKLRENVYLRTYVANKVMSLFFSILNYYKVTDVATCYKLMPSNIFKKLNLTESGFSIEIEMLSKFLKYKKSIIEVPISYKGRSYSEGKKIRSIDGFYYILNTIKYRYFF